MDALEQLRQASADLAALCERDGLKLGFRNGKLTLIPKGSSSEPPPPLSPALSRLLSRPARTDPLPLRPPELPTLELEQLGVPPQPRTLAGIPVNVGPVVPVPPGRFGGPRYPNAAQRKWHPR